MVDNDLTPESTPAPRRRRAASRPAGSPVAAPVVVEVPQTQAAGTAAVVEGAETTTPTRRRATRSQGVTETPAAEGPSTDASLSDEPAAPTRRRRITRAAQATAEPAAAPAADVPEARGEEAAVAAPPRRRRAARPAADTIPASVETPAVDVPAVVEQGEPVIEAAQPTRRRRVTRAAAAAAPEVQAPAAAEQAPEAAPATQTRRRRATRETAPAEVEAAPAPAPEVAPEPEATAPAAATRRRRATREAATPAPVAPIESVATTTAASREAAPAEAAEVVQAPVAQPARRRRAVRETSAPQAVAPVAEVPQTTAAGTADVVTAPSEPAAPSRRRRATREAGVAATPPAADVQEAVSAVLGDAESATERPSRRRRGRGREEHVETTPDATTNEEPEDAIAAALRMAEEQAQSRRKLVADPFAVPAQDRQATLDELASSIAADDIEGEDLEDEDEDELEVEEGAEEVIEETESDESEESEESEDDRPSRRRRRRGGRRRRRGGSREDGDAAEEGDAETSDDEAEGESSESDESDSEGTDEDSDGTTRRRRRRRRRTGESDPGSVSDEVTGIEGSTRMEAKRQRRKENRAAGRRRPPILSEAEFLARRESVDRALLIRQGEDYTQLAVLEDGILVEHYVDRASATSLIGNIYLGRVQNILPSMEAAFIDIGRGRNAVLYAGEVDWDSYGVSHEDRRVEKVFKSGQPVLVQVTKDPVGSKGARLTGHISLPGRYIVYSPGGHLSGISRKLPDQERGRLRDILGELITDSESVIVRTAAEGVSSEELIRDVNRLKAQWEVIEKKVKAGHAPEALYSEPDLTLRIVRDLFTEDFARMIVQGDGGPEDAYDAISAYVGHVAPHLADRLQKFEPAADGRDLYAQYRIDEQIAKALDRKVFLPSGGSLVIDRTEAMTVIDVNTGRFTGTGGNLEATVTSNNLEAAEEIVRQLRLRDLGGIIVIDFIDMVLPSNRDLLLRRLIECLGRDRTRHQVAEVTSLGLVQLTRKRIGTGLAEAFTEECEHCHGAGYVKYDEPVDSQAPSDGGERSNRRRGGRRGGRGGSDQH